jgi:hypothetical protein
MKSQDMSKSLRAFARLLTGHRAEHLARFAQVFEGGKSEPAAARAKRILAVWKRSGAAPGHPQVLKHDLQAVEAALAVSGARTQAKAYQAVLSLFAGREGASLDDFVGRALEARDAPPPSKKKAEGLADHDLARRLADELTATVLDPPAFGAVVSRLEDGKLVSTATLGVVANYFLNNTKSYKGRKAAIAEIKRRHRDDLRSHARSKALDRLGV